MNRKKMVDNKKIVIAKNIANDLGTCQFNFLKDL